MRFMIVRAVTFQQVNMNQHWSSLKRLEEEFPRSGMIDMAFTMRGNIHESMADFEDAEKYYLQALEVAEHAQ